MTVRGGIACALALALAALAAGPASAAVRAGVGVVDATWHVGASAGQYASDGTFFDAHGADPHTHSVRRASSYGVQSRLTIRALVVEGSNGGRVALVKNDLYIPQDLLYRRTAQILEERGTSGIDRSNLTMAVSHNHSSPYYSTPSWGVWAFQDVFDFRFFEYYAQQMAAAAEKAAKRLRAVRVGASVSSYDFVHRNVPGPQVADDGTPAGFPNDYTDHDLTVVRFDDISRGKPRPYANVVAYSLHPEFLEGNDLISADYLGPLERMADRETGATTIWTQSAVGSSEPEDSRWHPVEDRAFFSHFDYAQAERGARGLADAIVDTWKDIARETPEDPDRFVPFDSDFEVAMEDKWFPGPASHPYPGVSSCRTDAALEGDPRAPIVGLPDCESRPRGPSELEDFYREHYPGVTTDDIQQYGLPVPENYSAPSYTGLEEDVSVHLQAFKLGEILFTVCSCEQWADQSLNVKSRTNERQGDQYNGYDWTDQCTQDGNGTYGGHEVERPDGYGTGTWTCPRPGGGAPLTDLPDKLVQRARAQVENDARGWDDLSYVPFAESEPTDIDEIKGNYTHEEIQEIAGARPYRLTVALSMANDYNGYIVSYREYQRGDHYRKALTAWGPHSSDYMATRLVRMGASLNGGPPVPTDEWPGGEQKVQVDLAHNDVRAAVIGGVAATAISAYERQLPDDGGKAEVEEQPADVQRFGAAFFTWNGGSNWHDNPVATVERLRGGRFEPYADQSGELPVTLRYPRGEDLPSYRAGQHRWLWTAHFEAFVSDIDTGERPKATPAGVYRFHVEGVRREGGELVPYELDSREFSVGPWTGVAVEDMRSDGGVVSFRSGPRHTYQVKDFEDRGEANRGLPPLEDTIGPIDYPDTYESPVRFVRDQRRAYRPRGAGADVTNPDKVEWFCFTCSFRPWIDTGEGERAVVTFIRANGSTARSGADLRDGRWVAERRLGSGEAAYVESGDFCDRWGNYNEAPSGRVGDSSLEAKRAPAGYSCVPRRPRLSARRLAGGPKRRAARNPLGLPVRCTDRRKWRFRIHQPRGGRIVAVTAYVNGGRVLKRRATRGRIRAIRLRRLPLGRFRVRIVAVTSAGSRTISTRRYDGCTKSKPKTRVKRKRRRGR